MSQVVLEVSNLSKRFGDFKAVKNVSFTMKHGEILGLLGPNGAGKSTTISMLLGVLSPTSGDITYFGKDFLKHQSEVLQEVTFASTYIKMPWRLTVMENLRVYAYLHGLSRTDFLDRAKRFLSFFEVWDQRDKTMNNLSAGQVTRVMLAKAFMPYPKIVLLDEPTASLDPDIAHGVRRFIKEQQSKFETTILYTSHNMDEVSDVCDRVIFLRKGKIVAEDTPENLAKSVSIARMSLQVADGLKRTSKLCAKLGLKSLVTDRDIEIEIDEHRIASFLSQLAESGIEYTQISIAKPTLEDYFLSLSS